VRPCKEPKPLSAPNEVGSLLRPPRIKEARARLEKGEISADDLRKVEDMEIEKVVHKSGFDRPEACDRRRVSAARGGISIFLKV